jgi:uncharacterized integral membrane protein
MTIRRFFNWVIGLPIAVVAIVFAVANRQWITVSFDPLNRDQPFAAVDMPLWVLFFCGIFVGLLVGWGGAWLAQGKWRKATREARSDLARAQSEHDRLKRDSEQRALAAAPDASL